MKILCLHGSGTSADIFRAQTASMRAKLDPKEYQFDFLDAPYPWQAGPGVGPFFDGPYYSWWQNQQAADVQEATKAILKRLETTQYDALLGFSQGCNAIASLILFYQAENPGKPLPFKGAMFTCGGVPLWILETWLSIPTKAREISEESALGLNEVRAQTKAKIEAMLATGERQSLWDRPTAVWDGKDMNLKAGTTMPHFDPKDVFGLDISDVPSHMRITIPTVHVYGHKDPICTSSLQLASLCDSSKRLVYDHAGGHEIPRLTNVSEDLASAVRWLNTQVTQSN